MKVREYPQLPQTRRVGEAMRAVLEEKVRDAPRKLVVPLSGGADSTSILLAVIATGGKEGLEAWSFKMEDVESTDHASAEENAAALGVPFRTITLRKADRLADLEYLMARGFEKKTALECGWPMLVLLREAARERVRTVITGSAADGHYGLSKKAMIHFSPKLETFDEFRRDYFADPDKAQVRSVTALGDELGVRVRAPYHSPEMLACTLGVPWEVLNRPRQKEAIRGAFPEMDALRTGRHINLQLGDSGIAAGFAEMAEEAGYSSAMKMYSTLAKQREAPGLF